MNNIAVTTEYSCSGCGACAAICPVCAITLKRNCYGFFEAVVDGEKCIRCGFCRNVCTRFDAAIQGKNIRNAALYAVQSADTETVKKCSSGGAAHEIAKWALQGGCKLCGAVYDTASDTVFHRITENADALDGSKYLQSDTSVFHEVIHQAEQGQRFAVFGTPCQISGLAKTAEQKNIRDRFLLIEIFCHGVPSYKLWERECDRIKKKLGCNRFDDVRFRYKKNGWHSYCLRFEAKGKAVYGSREGDLFYRSYFDDVLLNDACLHCRMRGEYSLADIRLGDYWGKRYAERNDGVSAVYCNTERGRTAVTECGFINFEAGTAEEQLSCQNMRGYTCGALQKETMTVLAGNGTDAAIRYYKARLPIKNKVKNMLLSVAAGLPDDFRARVRRMR